MEAQETRWFDHLRGYAREHRVRLDPRDLGDKIFFKTKSGRSRSSVQSLLLPPVQTLPTIPDNHRPPKLSDIKVTDVRKGITASATITWTTDEFSESTVLYGRKNLNSSKYDPTLTRSHEMVLIGLDPEETYQFQVISRDLHGQTAESAVRTFSTRQSFFTETAAQVTATGVDAEVQWQLYQADGGYLAVFTAEVPFSLSLGTNAGGTTHIQQVNQAKASAPSGHPVLKSHQETNITVCRTCHTEIKENYSHPVNVVPSPNMIIPPEYPLLPDGRISCMSCHSPHGANYEYRLIKSGKAELCRGCHRDY